MEKSSELQTGPCIHICERRQNTLNNLLKESAQKGHIINLKKWIKAGADIDASNNDKGIIMDFDNLTMDQSLRGVLPSKKSSIKNAPAELLLSASGAYYNTEGRKVFTPLQCALLGKQTKSHYEVVEFLLKKGASPNSECNSTYKGRVIKFTPAFHAVLAGNIGMLKLLTTYGADLIFKNYIDMDEGLLYHAIQEKQFEIVEFLLKNGISAKYVNKKNGLTPLHHAVEKGDPKIAKLFLTNGADVNATTFNDEAPIHSAVLGLNLKMVKLLIEHGANINTMKKFSSCQMSPLPIAVYKNDYEIVEFLLENGADVNQRCRSNDEISTTTPLHFACKNGGHNNIAELLMKYGAEIDAMEEFLPEKESHTEKDMKWTPLHYAASLGLHLIVRNLLKKGM